MTELTIKPEETAIKPEEITIKKLPVSTIEDLELNHDLEYHKLLDPDYNLYVGLLYRDHALDHRMHFNVIFWKDEPSNNCILDNFSPSPLTHNSDDWLNQAAQICVSMADYQMDINDKDYPNNKSFIECYESLKSIGLSSFDIEQLNCILDDEENNDED